MSLFPDTPVTMLARLAAERTGEDENTWVRFFELYQPVIAQFAVMVGARNDAEDVAQDVFAKLVEVFRNGAYDPRRGRFRSFLSTMIRNEVINRWHRDVARAADRHFSIDDAENPVEVSTPSATEAILDAKWRLACHEEAVDHVLNRTALSVKSKAIYRAYVLEDRPIDEVAAAFDVPRNSVSQVKTRVERMIAEHEALLGYT